MRSIKCFGCGAPVPFNPEELYAKCKFCGTEIEQNLTTKEIEEIRLINKKREREIKYQIQREKKQILFKKYKNLFLNNFKKFIYFFIPLIIIGVLIPVINSVKETKVKKTNQVINNLKILSNDLNKNQINQLEDEYEVPMKVREIVSDDPSLDEIQYILNTWLQNKKSFLSGKVKEPNLNKIVNINLIKRLIQERENDVQKGIYKGINATIEKIDISSKSSSRIAVLVNLKYSEKILNNNGDVLNTTTFTPFLKVKYILGYISNSWKLIDYVSGL